MLRVLNDKVLEIIPTDKSTGKRLQTVSVDNVKKASIDLTNQIAQQHRMSLLNKPQIFPQRNRESSESSEDNVPMVVEFPDEIRPEDIAGFQINPRPNIEIPQQRDDYQEIIFPNPRVNPIEPDKLNTIHRKESDRNEFVVLHTG